MFFELKLFETCFEISEFNEKVKIRSNDLKQIIEKINSECGKFQINLHKLLVIKNPEIINEINNIIKKEHGDLSPQIYLFSRQFMSNKQFKSFIKMNIKTKEAYIKSIPKDQAIKWAKQLLNLYSNNKDLNELIIKQQFLNLGKIASIISSYKYNFKIYDIANTQTLKKYVKNHNWLDANSDWLPICYISLLSKNKQKEKISDSQNEACVLI